MKNYIILFIAFLSLAACNQQEVNNSFILSGKVFENKNDQFKVFTEQYDTTISIPTNELFSFQLPIENTEFIRFKIDDEYGTIYVSSGDSIYFEVDSKQFDESLTFQASKQLENNFLIQHYLLNEKVDYSRKELYKLPLNQYLEVIDLKNEKSNVLFKQFEKQGLNKHFKAHEQSRIELDYYSDLVKYPSSHYFFTLNKPELNEAFYKKLNGFDITNAKYLEFGKFDDIALEKLRLQKPLIETDDKKLYNKLLDRVLVITDQNIKDLLHFKAVQNQTYFSTNVDEITDQQKKFLSETENEALKEKMNKLIAQREEISIGKEAPEFTSFSTSDKEIHLSDLKGNLIYVDFWATWCGPCIEEIPHYNKIQERYKNDKITFYSVNLNRGNSAETDWKEFLETNSIHGLLSIAKKTSPVVKSYQIRGIPRYVLIDVNGKIAHPNAPRPSNEELIELIDAHLTLN